MDAARAPFSGLVVAWLLHVRACAMDERTPTRPGMDSLGPVTFEDLHERNHSGLLRERPTSATPVTWMRELLPGDITPARLGALNTTADVIGITRNTERDARTIAVTVIVSGTVTLGTLVFFTVLRNFLPAVYAWRQCSPSSPKPESIYLDWWRPAHRTTAEEGVEAAGLDGWMFVEFYRLMCCIFGSMGFLLAAVLCPLHLLAARRVDTQVDLLSRLDIRSIPQGSSLLWVHAMCTWYVVLLCTALIGNANSQFADLRLSWLRRQPQYRGVKPQQLATMVLLQKRVSRLDTIRRQGRWSLDGDAHGARPLDHECNASSMDDTTEWTKIPWEMCGRVCIIMIFLFWSPVVMFISGYTTSDALQTYVPLLRKWGRELPGLGVFLEGVFAALVLKLFMSMLPSVLLCIVQKFFLLKAGAEAQLRLERWYFSFLLLFILLVTVFSRSVVITVVQAFQQPSEVVDLLASSLPSTSHFYVNYFVMGWATTPLELMRFGNLLQYLFARLAADRTPSEAKYCSEPEDQGSHGMGARMALAAFMSTVALVFCTCSPVICVVAWIFFRIGRLTYGYLIVHAETKKPDTGGMFWVEALRQVCFGLGVYVVLTVGVLFRRAASFGPALIAASTLPVLYNKWIHIHDLSWGAMHLETCMVSDKSPQEDQESLTVTVPGASFFAAAM